MPCSLGLKPKTSEAMSGFLVLTSMLRQGSFEWNVAADEAFHKHKLAMTKASWRSKVVNRTLEMYLRWFTSSRPKEWLSWLSWAEYCYNTKLLAKYYGPFEVVGGVGRVAYKLKLPTTFKFYPVFHVSLLKKKIGDRERQSVRVQLPDLDQNDHLITIPQAIRGRGSHPLEKAEKTYYKNFQGGNLLHAQRTESIVVVPFI
ncbi:hypothetical protein JRO89_XS01G0089000 [Xanthoceras sorbifolium]|uniref:Tf2-1-like SH3-like domain-containing protein n=1 Tax=Xanthoceras sorbifolium TaxID=99658 RepID=A0ABQ8IK07_9ROSI|nr:hypothetical protein JRO89_XS01G0089000 [Xanthoceras sorbifolium]